MFSWVQRKLKGKPTTTNSSTASSTSNTRPSTCNEEFGDWPNELLSIGTFGNTNTLTEQRERSSLQERTNDEVVEKSSTKKFSSCLENLQDRPDRRYEENWDGFAKKDCRFGRSMSMSLAERRGQNSIYLEKNNTTNIQKKSLSYLFKKVFACSGGLSPKNAVFIDPLLRRDSLLKEPKFETSRLEKIFRTIMHKIVYPQGSSPRPATKKYLYNKNNNKENERAYEKLDCQSYDGGKWVRTDSKYIVLEI